MLPQGQKILETTGKKYTGWTITSYGPFPSKSPLRKNLDDGEQSPFKDE